MMLIDPQEENYHPPRQPQMPLSQCSQGHRSTLTLQLHSQDSDQNRLETGGSICLLCLSNLITNPRAPTFHVSYALSQLSTALDNAHFVRSLFDYHPHFLVSPIVNALSLFGDDHGIARQLLRLISAVCVAANCRGLDSVSDEFFVRIADRISSGALSWSPAQGFMLHCFGALLSSYVRNPWDQIKDKGSLFKNLVTGLQLPSEEIRGEILYVLHNLSIRMDGDGTEVLSASCPKLLRLSLEALLKTHDDTVRSNCVAFLVILVQKGLCGNAYTSSIISGDADHFIYTEGQAVDGPNLHFLFAEAIKGPLLSSDKQIQVSTLDLLFHYLSSESTPGEQIQVMVEENITDYVFEILRLSDCRDPIVTLCLLVLNLLSASTRGFKERLIVGFSTLIPVLQYVAEVPFHPVQCQTLKLISSGIFDCPGIVSTCQVDELVPVLSNMLKRHTDGDMGLPGEAFYMVCSTLVALLESPSFQGTYDLLMLVQEATSHAISSCLDISEKSPSQFLHALYLLKEVYGYTHHERSTVGSDIIEVHNCVVDICTSHLLPWIKSATNKVDEEIILGIFEIFHSILLQDLDVQFANSLVNLSWFSLSFGYLGLFSTEKMKMRVYHLLSSLVDVLLGSDTGQPIRAAASDLPIDPIDLLFLLEQKSLPNTSLSSCQSAVLLILHASSLYNDRFADEKSVLTSLEQYVLVNQSDFLNGVTDTSKVSQVINTYAFYRVVTAVNYHMWYSLEAERTIFDLVIKNELDLTSSSIHFLSLKWLFQQEKLISLMTDQILQFCKNCEISVSENNHVISMQKIAELATSGDTFLPQLLVCLLKQYTDEATQEHDILSVLNLLTGVIKLSPAASDQFCQHGLSNAIRALCVNTDHASSERITVAISVLLFNVLQSVHPEAICDDEDWVAVTMKLMDFLVTVMDSEGCSDEAVWIIAIFSLILHQSMNEMLMEASKFIIFNASLVSMTNDIISLACSKGPALHEYDEGTATGQNLILVLFLCYFSIKSLDVVFHGTVDWQNLLGPADTNQPLPAISIHTHDLCRLMHFGSPAVKLVSSYCLLELITRLSKQRSASVYKIPEGSMGYLMSIIATLEGLIYCSNTRVSINCSICLSMIMEWEELRANEVIINTRNTWCRLIVEEMAMLLATPCLPSKSFSDHHKPAVHLIVALLRLQNPPEWMSTVIDENCISSIISNLTAKNISWEIVVLLQELKNAKFLKAEEIPCLNQALQECRKNAYKEDNRNNCINGHTRAKIDELGKVWEYPIYLMSSTGVNGSWDSQIANRRLLEAIDKFFDMADEADS